MGLEVKATDRDSGSIERVTKTPIKQNAFYRLQNMRHTILPFLGSLVDTKMSSVLLLFFFIVARNQY